MTLIVKNGTIVTASETYRADIAMTDGVVAAIRGEINPTNGDSVIDASGQYVFPGGIDPHVHFGHPDYADDFESGTRAAAAGGVTTVLNFVEPPPAGKTLLENLRDWKAKAVDSCIDYGLQPILTEPHCDEFVANAKAFRDEGVSTVKLFMSARGIGLLVSDAGLYKIIKATGEHAMIATVHCENGDVIDELVREAVARGDTGTLHHGLTRPTFLEEEATNRIIAIAQAAKAPIRIAHVSCLEAVDAIRRGQRRGVRVVGETCAHYLTRDIRDLDKDFAHSARYICSPPLRDKSQQDALWTALRTGALTTMGSDHAPVRYENGRVNKLQGKHSFNKIPNGGPGVEEMFSVMYHFGVHERRISLNAFVAVTSANAAKQMGVYPQKGGIHPGGDGDLVILDPKGTRTLTVKDQHHRADYNAYEGMTLNGRITHVVARGEVIIRDNAFLGEKGRGRYLKRGDVIL